MRSFTNCSSGDALAHVGRGHPFMPLNLSVLSLDWKLARERFERDIRDDFFPDVLRNRDVFVAAKGKLDDLLRLDAYSPEPAEDWEAPKANFSVRHCINVAAVDRLVYQALVDPLTAPCDSQFLNCSYAFRLRSVDAAEMYKSFAEQRELFDGAVRNRLAHNSDAHVAMTDVSSYFENVVFDVLRVKLVALTGAVPDSHTIKLIDALMFCLSTWSPYRTYGLPQNMFPSSFLGNVYLHSLDVFMTEEGFDYHRYMDDIRVVTADESEARQALRCIHTHLRLLNLSVNGGKTDIARPGSSQWTKLTTAPDSELADIESIVKRQRLDELPQVIVRLDAMLRLLIDEGQSLDRRRLKFCLGRLSSIRRLRKANLPVVEPTDGYGAKLIALVKWLPEETSNICEYFHLLDCSQDIVNALSVLLRDNCSGLYPSQKYRLWLLASEVACRDVLLLDKAREVVIMNREPAEVAGAAVYLGAGGDDSDGNLLAVLADQEGFSISVRRALCIAIQHVPGVDTVLTKLAEASASVAVLVQYLSKLRTPAYAGRARRITLRRLSGEMPDMFS